LIYKEEGSYVAHCLELDIVGSGGTPEEALKEMRELVEEQISFHFEHGIENKLFRPAPAEYWNKWLKSKPFPVRQDKPLHDSIESMKIALVEEDGLVVA
jgi:predicted RNase H-like HicB family nuclease